MIKQVQLGDRIRQIRESRKLDRNKLAERASISEDLLEQIENNEMIPSLSPLIKIARSLGVRLGTFLDDELTNSPVIVRSGASDKVIRFKDSSRVTSTELDFYSLAANKKDRHMEPFLINLSPPEDNDLSLSTHEGEEFIYVLQGSVRIQYGQKEYILQSGDSIYYDSILPHGIQSNEKKGAKILAVIHTPA